MTDVKTEIKDFAVKEETAAKAWLGSNLVPLGVGAGLMGMVWLIAHLL